MKIIFVAFIVLITACYCNTTSQKPRSYAYPEKGLSYESFPDPQDSSFPFYPARRLLSSMDSTHDAFYTRILLHRFNETNISLRPANHPIFRLTPAWRR